MNLEVPLEKIDVIWTINFKITAKIEERKHCFDTYSWQTSCITSVGHNFMFFQYDEMHLAGLLIGLDKKSEIMPQFRGRLYYKIGLLCDKLYDF